MIECPFCSESFEEDELVFEFNWGSVTKHYYNSRDIELLEPSDEFMDRAFYVRFKYGHRGRPGLKDCSPNINLKKHLGDDPLNTGKNKPIWDALVKLLKENGTFEVESDDDYRSLPVAAKILPMVKDVKRHKRHERETVREKASGMSTGVFCPICEQRLTSDVLKAQTEVRILLAGRRGSGKTVYTTQVISELLQGRLAKSFTIEAANHSVYENYINNKNRLRVGGNGFVSATDPGVVQDPYIFLLRKDNNTIRLVLQDIAGEDTENGTKYSIAVRKADMVLFFVDPWHIEEIRTFHERNNDQCNEIVMRTTGGRYTDLNGVFGQMLGVVDSSFADKSGQLAGVLLVKGDYLNPPMLTSNAQPECQMMQRPVSFSNSEKMEFELALRSSFVRQLMQEWESTRSFSREVEGKYSAHNTRYFVSSALGQSTILHRGTVDAIKSESKGRENPDVQFGVDIGAANAVDSSETWDYDEQGLGFVAVPNHVIDPIFWCLKRRGVKF